MICGYCDKRPQLVTGKEVYPHLPKLRVKKFYYCAPCNALVGCHEGTTAPLGSLAKPELRKARMSAHAAFDPLWRNGKMKRKSAYKRLADFLGIEITKCHIGMFNETQCALQAFGFRKATQDIAGHIFHSRR